MYDICLSILRYRLALFRTDIDECSSSPCQNDGTCTDEVNGYTCSCVAGYTGTNCETSKSSIHNILRNGWFYDTIVVKI